MMKEHTTASCVIEIPGRVRMGELELWGFLIKVEKALGAKMKKQYGCFAAPAVPQDQDESNVW